MSAAGFVPYCGNPPVPGGLSWNTDPVLVSSLLAVAAIYALGCRKPHAPAKRERAFFAVGWALVAAALISPLCNLSVALFSARVAQHLVLTLVAAPLIVLGGPGRAIGAMPRSGKLDIFRDKYAMGIGAAAFAIAIWTWHLPGPYDATLRNNYAYWAMHMTTFGSALVLWHALLHHGATRAGSALVAAFATGMQMSLLGAVLTLAPRPLFAVHFATTWPWGLSPLEDQQLGGLIMWIPAGTLFTAYAVMAFAKWLNSVSEPVSAVRSEALRG